MLWLICFLGVIKASAQLVLEVELIDQTETFFKKNIEYNQILSDSLSLLQELKSVIKQLNEKAYLEASIDSLTKKDSLYHECNASISISATSATWVL